MKRFQRIVIILIFIGVVAATYGMEFYGKYTVPIMVYHEVMEDDGDDGLNTVSKKNFEYQMEFLRKHDYNVISLSDLVNAIQQRKPLPHNSVVVTFDDGPVNNYVDAFPILKRYKIPAMIFIVAEKVGTKDFLTWQQIREMEAAGIEFGSHSRYHRYLPPLSDAGLRDEIFSSKRIIEQNLGHAIDHFCYPNGGFTEQAKRYVREAGYRSACTTNRGHARLNQDLYELKRMRFGDKDSVYWNVLAKLSGYYNLFRKTVNPN